MGIHNLTINCEITFEEAVFSGHYKSPNFEGYREITGEIINESYGAKTGQHTFTILIAEISGAESEKYSKGDKIKRKGRNIYRALTKVKYPENHANLAIEKNDRAKIAKDLKEAYFFVNPDRRGFYG